MELFHYLTLFYIPAPYTSPGNVQITASTSSSLTISWDEIHCANRNGIITGYPYELYLKSDINTALLTSTTTSTSVTISSGLTPDTEYFIRVAAKTNAGSGSWSNYVSLQTMAVSKYMNEGQ